MQRMYDNGVSPSVTHDYKAQASNIAEADHRHCFDGEIFTDGVAKDADPSTDYSIHAQVWAALCGASNQLLASETFFFYHAETHRTRQGAI